MSDRDAGSRRPNVIFFFTDDQRFDTVRALGNDRIHTPNIDSLVARGTTFRKAYIMGGTCGAVCMPSRAMLHSGRTLFHIDREGQSIPTDHVTLGETLRRAGYTTFGTGKWHNGPASYSRSFSTGAEIFFGGMMDHWNVPAFDFDPKGNYDAALPYCVNPSLSNEVKHRRCDHIHAGKHSTDLFCDASIDFLRSYRDEAPFFMYVSFMAPHDPRTMPKRFLDKYDPEDIPLPESFVPEHPFNIGWYGRDEKLEVTPRPPDAIRQHIAEYYAMITHLDDGIGRVLAALEESGRSDDTIIVFAGDNGLAVGRHGLMGKQSNYDHSVHVPLVMAGPGVPEGERRDAVAYLLDIYPTLCELAGLSAPDTVEGKSLVPAMREDAKIRDSLYFAYTHLHRGVREGDLKLIEYVVEGARTTQLFDLGADPYEIDNLAADPARAGDLERLRKELVRWRDELDDSREKEASFWEGYEGTSP